MRKYKVVVEGNSYKTARGNRPRRLGFYTTRFIEARDCSTAKTTALELVTEELGQIVRNNPEEAPHIDVSQLDEIDSFAGCEVPGSGFTWYMEG